LPTPRPEAMIDIGSNSIRSSSMPARRASPRSSSTRRCSPASARGWTETGKLAPAPQVRALAALRRFRLLVDEMEVDDLHVLATAAVREASNGGEFLRRCGRSASTRRSSRRGGRAARRPRRPLRHPPGRRAGRRPRRRQPRAGRRLRRRGRREPLAAVRRASHRPSGRRDRGGSGSSSAPRSPARGWSSGAGGGPSTWSAARGARSPGSTSSRATIRCRSPINMSWRRRGPPSSGG
jgi:hypothetical protein